MSMLVQPAVADNHDAGFLLPARYASATHKGGFHAQHAPLLRHMPAFCPNGSR